MGVVELGQPVQVVARRGRRRQVGHRPGPDRAGSAPTRVGVAVDELADRPGSRRPAGSPRRHPRRGRGGLRRSAPAARGRPAPVACDLDHGVSGCLSRRGRRETGRPWPPRRTGPAAGSPALSERLLPAQVLVPSVGDRHHGDAHPAAPWPARRGHGPLDDLGEPPGRAAVAPCVPTAHRRAPAASSRRRPAIPRPATTDRTVAGQRPVGQGARRRLLLAVGSALGHHDGRPARRRDLGDRVLSGVGDDDVRTRAGPRPGRSPRCRAAARPRTVQLQPGVSRCAASAPRPQGRCRPHPPAR